MTSAGIGLSRLPPGRFTKGKHQHATTDDRRTRKQPRLTIIKTPILIVHTQNVQGSNAFNGTYMKFQGNSVKTIKKSKAGNAIVKMV
jgi:hypothetical protein